MAAVAPGEMVPITREFLAEFYEGYPLPAMDPRIVSLREKMDLACETMAAASPPLAKLRAALAITAPKKIDENLFRNREQLEELLLLMKLAAAPAAPAGSAYAACAPRALAALQKSFERIEAFQTHNVARISDTVGKFLPNDFRGYLIKLQRDRSEASHKAAVEALVARGGTVKERYHLLWEQQMGRRKMLAALGSTSGFFRTMISYLAGVPPVLLEFVQRINDDDGPMEEQRSRYGPALYRLTALVASLRCFAALWLGSAFAHAPPGAPLPAPLVALGLESTESLSGLVVEVAELYHGQADAYIGFITRLFENSPFFITASQASLAHAHVAAAAPAAGKEDPAAVEQARLALEKEVAGLQLNSGAGGAPS